MTTQETQPHGISINIARYRVVFTTADADMAARLRQRYAAFLSDAGVPEVTIALDIRPGARYIKIEPGPWIIESTYSEERLTYRSYLEQGEVDWKTRTGRLEMAPEAHVENFLRVIYAWLCLRDGGLLLHAAGLIRDGRGFVFFGPSGAGKTTTTLLSADVADVLSDDLVILRRENGHCQLYGVPFRGDLSDAPRANQQAPLLGIFRLYQDSTHYLQTMPAAIAIAELAASSPFIVRDVTLGPRLLAVCRNIVESTPVQAMHFRRDSGFWKEIDGYYQHLSTTAPTNGR